MKPSKTRLLLVVSVLIAVTLLVVSFMVNGSIFGVAGSGNVKVEPAKLIWEKTYGGSGDDRAFSAAKVDDGFLVVGSSKSLKVDETVGWVLRLNSIGEVVWNWTFSVEDGSEFRQVLSLTDGFLLVGNVFKLSGDVDGYVLRTDSEGRLMWNITLGSEGVDRLFSATETADGFVLAGLTSHTAEGVSSVWIVKISGNGSVVWQKTFHEGSESAGRSVVCDGDDCLVAGYTSLDGSENYDFLMMKLNTLGEVVWNRTYGGLQSDKAYALTKVSGGFVVVGDTRSKGMGDNDAWVVKVDSDGDIQWDTTFGGKDYDSPTCVTISTDGGLLVGGFTFSFGNGKRDFWLTKLDGSGRELWSCTQGGAAYEEAYVVLETAKDDFVMAGWKNYVEGGPYDYCIVKISPTNVGK